MATSDWQLAPATSD